jgi:glutamine amidotransferase-like uncharacterized protein
MQQSPYQPYLTLFTKPVMPRASKYVHVSLACLVLLFALSACTSSASTEAPTTLQQTSTGDINPSGSTGIRPVALVYRGPAGCPGCSEAVAALLQSSKWGFDVKYVGPNESLSISDGLKLPNVKLYAQPGGGANVSRAYRRLKSDASDIQNFVKNGGRYLGICMGGYLAGATPGFKLLPGDTNEFITSPGATVKNTKDTIVQVNWRGKSRYMYFQDGPYFILNRGATGVTVLATYTNGEIAAMVAPYGKGKVGGSGLHPEADRSWYSAYDLPYPGSTQDLGNDLIDTLMQ